jgi:hypothetical protein
LAHLHTELVLGGIENLASASKNFEMLIRLVFGVKLTPMYSCFAPTVVYSTANCYIILPTDISEFTEPINLYRLKTEINRRWRKTSLLYVLKETDLRVNFTEHLNPS